MTTFKELNTGQIVTVEGERVARFQRMARWVETDEKPTAKKTETKSSDTAEKKTTRRGGRRSANNEN